LVGDKHSPGPREVVQLFSRISVASATSMRAFSASWTRVRLSVFSRDRLAKLVRKERCCSSGFAEDAIGDSHELITFMLDSFHEDLNRLKKSANGRARNDSVIGDIVHGQLKS
jgi:ubiquitin C-terminal hydrolase